MVTRWVPDAAGDKALMLQLAGGLNNFAEHVRKRVKEVEQGLERYHFHSPNVPSTTRYANTINQATYLNGELVGGKEVRGVGNVARSPLRSVIYTTSFLGHLLEITGASPHDIEIPVRGLPTGGGFVVTVRHPGFARRPHFLPGLLTSVSEVGVKMRGTALVGRGPARTTR